MKRCPIAAKIAGSTGIMPIFSLRGMNVCPICEASVSHYTFVYGIFGPIPITRQTAEFLLDQKFYYKTRVKISIFFIKDIIQWLRYFLLNWKTQDCRTCPVMSLLARR